MSIIDKLNLDEKVIDEMYSEANNLMSDPVRMDAFYLEMRLSNDPDMSKHAEDYNLMVLEMVK